MVTGGKEGKCYSIYLGAMGWAIALHGGAGDISKDLPTARKDAALACLHQCLELGVSALQSQQNALDVAELVVS